MSTTPEGKEVALTFTDNANVVQAIEYAAEHGWPTDAREWLERIAKGIRLRAATPSALSAAPEGDEARLVCFEAYQVVGSMLSDLGQFDTDLATKVLDNLSQARMVHNDVLPWPSFEAPKES